MSHNLSQPERFTITGPQGETYRGGNQEWYRDLWQRRAGCGPTTAATLLAYLSQTHPSLAPMAPAAGHTQAGFLQYMEALWPYVTPGSRGLDKPESLVLGCRSFALSRGCVLQGRSSRSPAGGRTAPPRRLPGLSPPGPGQRLPGGLSELLQRLPAQPGQLALGPLLALTEGEGVLLCTILDEGAEKVIDLALWQETTLLGGALVSLFPDPAL